MEFRCKYCGRVWFEPAPFEDGRMEFSVCDKCAGGDKQDVQEEK